MTEISKVSQTTGSDNIYRAIDKTKKEIPEKEINIWDKSNIIGQPVNIQDVKEKDLSNIKTNIADGSYDEIFTTPNEIKDIDLTKQKSNTTPQEPIKVIQNEKWYIN